MSWICRAEWLAPAHPGAEVTTCAHGDSEAGAERHTKETGHPTTSGPHEAEKRSTT